MTKKQTNQRDCIDSLHRLGLQPIVLVDSEPKHLFQKTEQRGTPLLELLEYNTWDRLHSVLARNEIPFVSLLGVQGNKRWKPKIPDALSAMVQGLQQSGLTPTRFVVLHEGGGLGTRFVPLAAYPSSHEMIEYMSVVLNPLGPTCTGILTHPLDVDRFMATLVTEKPPLPSSQPFQAPTLFRSHIQVTVHDDPSELDTSQIRKVLQGAFGKPVPDSYLDSLSSKQVVVAKTGTSYLGVSILEHLGYTYLDKFAIVKEAQGLGIADLMWDHVVRSGRVFWRARASNKANGWYFERSDGTIRFSLQDEWVLFWVGDVDVDQCLNTVRSLPSTFG
jgi:hypothetical protein